MAFNETFMVIFIETFSLYIINDIKMIENE